jgi:hypothetical protein
MSDASFDFSVIPGVDQVKAQAGQAADKINVGNDQVSGQIKAQVGAKVMEDIKKGADAGTVTKDAVKVAASTAAATGGAIGGAAACAATGVGVAVAPLCGAAGAAIAGFLAEQMGPIIDDIGDAIGNAFHPGRARAEAEKRRIAAEGAAYFKSFDAERNASKASMDILKEAVKTLHDKHEALGLPGNYGWAAATTDLKRLGLQLDPINEKNARDSFGFALPNPYLTIPDWDLTLKQKTELSTPEQTKLFAAAASKFKNWISTVQAATSAVLAEFVAHKAAQVVRDKIYEDAARGAQIKKEKDAKATADMIAYAKAVQSKKDADAKAAKAKQAAPKTTALAPTKPSSKPTPKPAPPANKKFAYAPYPPQHGALGAFWSSNAWRWFVVYANGKPVAERGPIWLSDAAAQEEASNFVLATQGRDYIGTVASWSWDPDARQWRRVGGTLGDSEVRSPTSTSTEVRSPTSTSTEVRSPTSTSTEAYTQGNFTVTVTGGAGAGATNVSIEAPPLNRQNVAHSGGAPKTAHENVNINAPRPKGPTAQENASVNAPKSGSLAGCFDANSKTWGPVITDMPAHMEWAGRSAVHGSKGRPRAVRGPDGVDYLFALENGALTARRSVGSP